MGLNDCQQHIVINTSEYIIFRSSPLRFGPGRRREASDMLCFFFVMIKLVSPR